MSATPASNAPASPPAGRRLPLRALWDFALVLGGRFSNLAVVFLGGVLVARTSGGNEYGVFAVAMALVLLGDGFIGAPFDFAAVRFFALHPDEPERAQRFEAFTLQLKLLLALVVSGAVFVARPLLAWRWPALGGEDFPFLACFFALVGLLAARSTATSFQNRKQFRLYSAADLVQGLLRVAGFAGLAVLKHATAAACIWVYAVAAFGVAAFGYLRLRQRYLLGRWPERQDSLHMLGYCGFTAAIVTLSTLTGRGDLLLLAIQKGAGGSAAYGLASQLALLFAQTAMYASVLTQPRVLAFQRQGRLRSLFALNVGLVAVAAVVAWLAWNPSLLGRALVRGFGPEFGASVPLLGILMLGVVVDWLMVPVLVVFSIQECPKKAFVGEATIAVLFGIAGVAVLSRAWPWPLEMLVAWIATLARVAKLIVYGTLFLTHTRPAKSLSEK